ncbi:hypothetical protein GCM10009721_28050 [Terrabacter tumescens]|uniref:Uncharacterized protein n=1 Tax=Terrabacter tumescens TaxID=60443 RepID=A0ABQ2I3T0_9MICO|nr:hypothetical protein GCM10009721_28050 [Terrabacter tumescens]
MVLSMPGLRPRVVEVIAQVRTYIFDTILPPVPHGFGSNVSDISGERLWNVGPGEADWP